MNISVTAKRDFLTLLVAFFAVEALFSVLYVFRHFGIIPPFDITINGLNRSVTAFVFNGASIILKLLIFSRFMRVKEFGLTSKSRVGLVLRMICLCWYPVANAIVLIIGKFDVYASFGVSFSQAICWGISVVGLFMFINGAHVEKQLRKFVKWTPFIPLIALIPSMVLSIIFDSNQHLLVEPFISASTSLVIFLFVYKLAKKELESYTEAPATFL